MFESLESVTVIREVEDVSWLCRENALVAERERIQPAKEGRHFNVIRAVKIWRSDTREFLVFQASRSAWK
jgi:hypothetical protein